MHQQAEVKAAILLRLLFCPPLTANAVYPSIAWEVEEEDVRQCGESKLFFCQPVSLKQAIYKIMLTAVHIVLL